MSINMNTIVADLGALTDAELETLQLAVNTEVAVRIESDRLENRIVVALTDAQRVGFTDAEIDDVFAKGREKVRKGNTDPANDKQTRHEPKKLARDVSAKAPTRAEIKKQQTTAT